ncbi:MAG: RluA family pseudouridine synthase, partial [Clostridia bacterium]|nr:RluA family pseudouridine synthase [Clostridia bacterium]
MYKSYTVNSNDAGQRLDKFLSKAIKALPQSMLYKALRTKRIKVNRKRAEANLRLCAGDVIDVYLSDDFFADDAPQNAFKTLTPHLTVVYEDANILVCDKRPGLIVHSDGDEEINTLINHIKAYLYRKGEYDPETENSFAPALCNRIDRNTGGLVIAAKTAAALRFINERIRNDQVIKRYLCAVHGVPEKKKDTLYGYMTKDCDNNLVTVYKQKPQNAKDLRTMITKYRVIAEKDGNALLSVELVTGRTHQIRAHLA